jgi:CRP-like cAMP-binding protein
MNELFSFLERFGKLSRRLKTRIRQKGKRMFFKKDVLIVKEGTMNEHLYFIVKGLARGFYYGKNDKEISAWFLGENNLIALAQSYYLKQPSRESIQALEDCELIRFSYYDLDRIYEDFPTFERFGRLWTMAYNFKWYNHAQELKNGTVEDRYKSLMQEDPSIIERVPKKYIASYLKTTPTHLSTIRT